MMPQLSGGSQKNLPFIFNGLTLLVDCLGAGDCCLLVFQRVLAAFWARFSALLGPSWSSTGAFRRSVRLYADLGKYSDRVGGVPAVTGSSVERWTSWKASLFSSDERFCLTAFGMPVMMAQSGVNYESQTECVKLKVAPPK